MANLELKHIYKIYPGSAKKSKKKEDGQRRGDFLAVKDFNMEIEDGEFIVFVGPSGCGKSTTLRMIAGLEDITAGELYIGDRLVNDVEPKDRDIAMVFQNYALYPHMNAYNNIAFGLKNCKIPVEKKDKDGNPVLAIDHKKIKELKKMLETIRFKLGEEVSSPSLKLKRKLDQKKQRPLDEITRKGLLQKKEGLERDLQYYQTTPVQAYAHKHMPKDEIKQKIQWAAGILGVSDLLSSKPKAMSGGQRQRIALGRAIVREPKVMLLDEPLSNLDAKLRTSMRSELIKLHEQLKTTFIYVTHDQIEAMTMGTRIVVMKDGIVQQIDSPTNLFDFPNNKFVAGFIGTPQMNFFDVKIQKVGENLQATFATGEVQSYPLKDMRTIDSSYLDGEAHDVYLGIRGENITIDDDGIAVSVLLKEILGNTTQLSVRLQSDQSDCVVCLSDRIALKHGDSIRIKFDPHRIHLFDKTSELSIMSREA